jgi:hypothetical protein
MVCRLLLPISRSCDAGVIARASTVTPLSSSHRELLHSSASSGSPLTAFNATSTLFCLFVFLPLAVLSGVSVDVLAAWAAIVDGIVFEGALSIGG